MEHSDLVAGASPPLPYAPPANMPGVLLSPQPLDLRQAVGRPAGLRAAIYQFVRVFDVAPGVAVLIPLGVGHLDLFVVKAYLFRWYLFSVP